MKAFQCSRCVQLQQDDLSDKVFCPFAQPVPRYRDKSDRERRIALEEIKAYKPKCCSKAYITKRACVEHEKRCLWNPDNEACHTCGKREVVDGEEKRWYCPVRDRLIGIFEAGNEMLPVSHCEDWEPN